MDMKTNNISNRSIHVGIVLFIFISIIEYSMEAPGKIMEEISSNDTKSTQFIYKCPLMCSCHYNPTEQYLKTSCRNSNANYTNIRKHESEQLNITKGIRHFGLNHIKLDYNTINHLTSILNENNLIQLTLHNVILDPTIFFNSEIFKKSIESLRKLRMHDIQLNSNIPITKPGDFILLNSYFRKLKNLDTIDLENTSKELGNLLMSAFPKVAHITMFNSSINTIESTSFSHLGDILQTLNVSTNNIKILPWGLLSGLPLLTNLDLSFNQIEHLQEDVFVGLKTLRKLNLSHNHIQYVDFKVFSPIISLHYIDLSYNELLQIFEPFFEDNVELRTLVMKNTWAHDIFLNPDTSIRSLTEMEKLLDTLERVETLDISDNQMKIIPEALTHLKHLKVVHLSGNKWDCTCEDKWVIDWLISLNTSTYSINTSQINCQNGQDLISTITTLSCTNTSIITSRTPRKYYGIQGSTKTIKCHPQNKSGPYPKIYWTLPRSGRIIETISSTHQQEYIHTFVHRILHNGDLFISNLTSDAFGLYICTAEYSTYNITHFIHLGVDTTIFLDVQLASILIGWLTSFGFLIAVIIIQLIRQILYKYGIDCSNITAPYKARRVRRFFDNMEQHKNNQLERLRDNYYQQVKRVKENCISQVERIRDSYSTQTKNLSDIRDYGAQQIQTVRDQYHDQIRRVSSYSTQQLCKLRENYVFQRNRVGKFSSHQLIRLRETYKWQAQTVNKILENLPRTLNLDSCRGVGACGRTDSIYFEEVQDEIILDPLQLECEMPMLTQGRENIENDDSSSVYFTPEVIVRKIQTIPSENCDEIQDYESNMDSCSTLSGI